MKMKKYVKEGNLKKKYYGWADTTILSIIWSVYV